jgi:hypothetical protein
MLPEFLFFLDQISLPRVSVGIVITSRKFNFVSFFYIFNALLIVSLLWNQGADVLQYYDYSETNSVHVI